MKNITLALITHSWNKKITIKVKGLFSNRKAANAARDKLLYVTRNHEHTPDYHVCGPIQLKRLHAKLKVSQDLRREAGVAKAAASRKKNKKKPHFILCPTCKSRSKKLYSEMGGLQTRKCNHGHMFEYDKWIADRAFWGPIFGNGAIPESTYNKPKTG